MKVTLSDTARCLTTLFEEKTEATAHDCPTFDDRAIFLVAAGDMATAIGPGGRIAQLVEHQLGRTVGLVEDADTPEALVASAFAPTIIRHIMFSRQNGTVAYVKVTETDHDVAADMSGKAIDTARELAYRHYDIDDIQLA